jgi:cell division septation protein DedD
VNAKQQAAVDAILAELHAFGLAYPGAHTKSPWPGHNDLAVNDKTFAYMSLPGEPLGVGCKLPSSAAMALMLPFCKPMAYGLGKSGWVSAKFDGDAIDIQMVKAWIDESYRAQAPKKFLKQLGAAVEAPAAKPAAKKPAAKKPSATKPIAVRKPAAKKTTKPAAKEKAAKKTAKRG